MKKLFSLFVLISAFMMTSFSFAPAMADEPSAPTVVAPAQPAAAQPAAATATTNTAAPGASTGAAPQQPSMMGMALPFLVMLGIMYFLMIRPQQKRMKEHQSLLTGLKAGDEVVTSAGIIGKIAGMSDKVVTLEVSNNVQLKILKSQVNQVVKGPIQDIRA